MRNRDGWCVNVLDIRVVVDGVLFVIMCVFQIYLRRCVTLNQFICYNYNKYHTDEILFCCYNEHFAL